MIRPSVRTRTQAGLALLVLVALSACTDGVGPAPTSPSPSDGGSNLAVQGTWAARISSPRAAALYFIVANEGRKDRLVGAMSREAGSVGMFEQGTDGSTDLVPVDSIKVPAGGSVNVEPGGFEVVLIDVRSPIVVGETLSVMLVFEHAGKIAVEAEVRSFVDAATLPKG